MAAAVLLGGSRGLPASFAPLVSRVVSSVVSSGRLVASGCCSGADALAVSAAWRLGVAPVVFCVGGPVGSGLAGFWSGSSPDVGLFPVACRPVWWAGGPVSVPLSARLARRSAAAVAWSLGFGSGSGVVLFVSRPLSGGSLLVARLSAGLAPLVVFPCGGSAAWLPAVASGSWVSAGSGVWAGGFRFVPAPSLFA